MAYQQGHYPQHPQQQYPQHPQQQYQQQQYQPNAPPSQHYGTYGNNLSQNVFSINAWESIGFNSDEELFHQFEYFKSKRYNALQAEELSKILNESQCIRHYYGISWNMELCKVMIAMLDRSKDGLLQYPEFVELLQCLTYWHQTFCEYDANRSRFIEARELGRLISEKFGYRLSKEVMTCLLKRYSRAMDDGRCLIAFDDFVALSVRLRAYTEAFRARDRSVNQGYETGTYPFSYDDFLQCVLCL